jgi:hypothetical protein
MSERHASAAVRDPAAADDPPELHRTAIRWLFRCLAAGLGLAQIISARNTVGPDARSYLELARAILRHDWAMTVNAYWSAVYPWLLAAVLGVFKPSLRWEFPVAHALAFPVLLACIAAFEFFWTSVLQARQLTGDRLGLTSPSLTSAQMWALGYSLFIWMVVGDLITAINPDLCMTTMILLDAGIFVRIADGQRDRRSLYFWFGVCLGVGYLVKAILFPMGLVFLAMMIVVCRRELRERISSFALALLMFVAIASPQIILLSRAKGRLTFSDTGKLNFAWYTYGLPLRDWQGEPAGSGTPVHPTRKIYDHPAVYEFNGPIRSSYPPWYDPTYWNEGLSPVLRLAVVAKHALHETFEAGLNLVEPKAWAVGMFLILLGCDVGETLLGIAACWYLLATSAIAFGLYCLTLVQSRYLSPWLILIWGAVLGGVRLRRKTAPLYGPLTTLGSFALVASIGYLVYGESVHGFHNDASAEYATAEGLQKMGLRPGENVGAIGFDNDAHWAYLARLNIVAEINTDETCLFWSEPATVQAEILGKFAQAGASAVVVNAGGGIRSTSGMPLGELATCARPGPEWRKIPGSPNEVSFVK